MVMYKIKTPNELYKGITEGVPFAKGIGYTECKNKRNVLVNDYGYEDVTEIRESAAESSEEDAETEGIDVEDLTVPQLKELAKDLNLTNYSKLTREELIEKIENA